MSVDAQPPLARAPGSEGRGHELDSGLCGLRCARRSRPLSGKCARDAHETRSDRPPAPRPRGSRRCEPASHGGPRFDALRGTELASSDERRRHPVANRGDEPAQRVSRASSEVARRVHALVQDPDHVRAVNALDAGQQVAADAAPPADPAMHPDERRCWVCSPGGPASGAFVEGAARAGNGPQSSSASTWARSPRSRS